MMVSRINVSVLVRSLLLVPLLLNHAGCDKEKSGKEAPGIDDSQNSEGSDGSSDSGDSKNSQEGSDSDPGDPDGPSQLPDPNGPDSGDSDPDGGNSPEAVDCDDYKHKPCDKDSDDPLHAIGINCPDSKMQIDATFKGAKAARGVRTKFGGTDAFDPREGKRYLVLGTGKIDMLDQPELATGEAPVCSADLGKGVDLPTLPAPMSTEPVGKKTCTEDPSLVGKGDCSNSIGPQWNAAALIPKRRGAFDYNELRLKMTVPSWAKSMSFDFAFMSTEYPDYFKQAYNDFFVVWLESEKWTGNISFDKNGKPISLNAGFFDFKDSSRGTPLDPDCPNGCDAKELHDTCLAEHASTKWLTTTVGVTPGEEIELIFAILDLGDSSLDSYAFIDNFQWGCDEKSKPETNPPPV